MVDNSHRASIVDPEVKIPAAVKAASARADKIHSESYNTKPAVVEEKTITLATTNDPTMQPPKDTSATRDTVTLQPPKELAPEVKPDTKEQVTTPSKDEPAVNWEHRYNSMKGRADSQTAQLRDMSNQIANLQATLASLNTKPNGASNGSGDTKPEFTPLTPDEVKEYGEDFLKVVARQAQEAMMPYVRSLEKQVADLNGHVSSVGNHVAVSEQQKMHDTLNAQMPNWGEINRDPRFISWLGLTDPYSGAIRHDMLTKAYERNNAPQVLAFFNGFLRDEAAVAPQETRQTTQNAPVITPQPVAKIPLADLAAPGRAKDTAANSPVEEPSFTTAQIQKFYADVRANKYAGRDADKLALENQIFKAASSGRVT